MPDKDDTPEMQVPASLDSLIGSATPAPTDNNLVDNTPATSPDDTASESSETSPESSEKNEWDDLLTEISQEESGELSEPVAETFEEVTAPKLEVVSTEPLAEPTAATPVAEQIVEEVVAAPVPQEPQTPTEPQQPVAQAPTQEQINEMNRQLMATFEEKLVPGYQFTSEEDVRELNTSPETALPKLAAKMHAQVVSQVIGQVNTMVQRQLPAMVQNLIQTTKANQEGTTAFYSAWGELNDPKYAGAVKAASDMLLQDKASQQLSREAYIDKLGKIAWMQAGLSANDLIVKVANRESGTTTPNVTTEVIQAPPVGLNPVNPGGGGAIPVPQPKSTNEFTAWAEELIAGGDI